MMKFRRPQRVGILGGGVIGLTCAKCLASDFDVTVVAEKIGYESNSRKATAMWHVYLVPETDLVLRWSQETLEYLLDLYAHEPLAGIELVAGTEVFRAGAPLIPSWAHIPPGFSLLTTAEIEKFNEIEDLYRQLQPSLASRPVIWGYRLQAPATDMGIYLPWLERQVIEAGAKFIRRKISSISELSNDYEIIINCSGFGARELASDPNFLPYKGQYFVLKRDPSAPTEYIGDDDNPGGMAYVIPRGHEVLVGGCALEGAEDLELTLDYEEVKQRSGLYVPWLRSRNSSDQARAPVVCIRPARKDGVRLELDETTYSLPVIHNYGHGGSGFSLAWGCAQDVVSILRNAAFA